MLRSRYLLVKWGRIPLAMPHCSPSGFRRATLAHGQGDLRITVRVSLSSVSTWASHSSSTSHHLVFPDELAGSSDRAGPSISFGAPADDRMSIAASEGELGSGDDDSAALPLSGRVSLPKSDPELTAMLSRAAEGMPISLAPVLQFAAPPLVHWGLPWSHCTISRAWLGLPRPSHWLLRIIRLSYAIQFARRPPKFRGARFTSVLNKDAPVLRAEVMVLLVKDAIEPVPPAEMKSGFSGYLSLCPETPTWICAQSSHHYF